MNILDFGSAGTAVDNTGKIDAAPALANAVRAANLITALGRPACVYIPAGVYRISAPPPRFARAGCVSGDGVSQSVLCLDQNFQGDLFAWSEAWGPTTPGPTIVGIKVQGARGAVNIQNAIVFYDRNDEVLVENVEVNDLHGRALYAGATKNVSQAYIRESRMRSLRFFRDGAPGLPVLELSSEGTGSTDATNEIEMSQVDIYGARGPGMVIRNNGSGHVRGIRAESVRIEGLEDGQSAGDLLTIGDPHMAGNVNSVTLTSIELIDPSAGFAALRLTAAAGAAAPYQIVVEGAIGGGEARGEGLRIDAGRSSTFRLSSIHTSGTNVVVGRGVSGVVVDGDGQERGWSFRIDPTSKSGVMLPTRPVPFSSREPTTSH